MTFSFAFCLSPAVSVQVIWNCLIIGYIPLPLMAGSVFSFDISLSNPAERERSSSWFREMITEKRNRKKKQFPLGWPEGRINDDQMLRGTTISRDRVTLTHHHRRERERENTKIALWTFLFYVCTGMFATYFSLENRMLLAMTGFFWRKLQRWIQLSRHALINAP